MWHFQVEYGSQGRKLLHWFKLCINDRIKTLFQLESVAYLGASCTKHLTFEDKANIYYKLLQNARIYKNVSYVQIEEFCATRTQDVVATSVVLSAPDTYWRKLIYIL